MTKTIGQARREAFEAWDRKTFGSDEDDQSKDENSDYIDSPIQQCWMAYNAALDSLCVVLPEMQIQVTDSDEGIRIYWPHEVIEAIHAAGVKTR